MVWLIFSQSAVSIFSQAAPAPVRFNRDIRPILSDNCFACHGPDEKQRKGKLRLDEQKGAFAERDGQWIIKPGSKEASLLFQRLTTHDPDDRMPPVDSGKELSKEQVDLVGAWIDSGAHWEGHWAFISPERPALPRPNDLNWPRNPIDHFVLARIEQEGLAPSRPAGKETLIRRASLDLTGLPPTPEEIDSFLADSNLGAYDQLVDRLLASPHFGERMGVHWLDLARYADTHGYHLDAGRNMSKWRDWVIGAFNENKAFDEFVLEQVAGDLLPNATREQRLATGFNRNNMINFEGGAIPEEYLTHYVVDRVVTTSTVFLGLTMGCAQCHDHKYDPISQKEFYQFYAYFNAVPEKGLDGRNGNAPPLIQLPSAEQEAELKELTAALSSAKAEMEKAIPEIDRAQLEWERAVAEQLRSDNPNVPEVPEEITKLLSIAAGDRTEAQANQIRKHYREQLSPEGKRLHGRIAEVNESLASLNKSIPNSMVMEQMANPRDTFVLIRGQYNQPGEKVAPGVPAVLPQLPPDAPPNRLGLAQWLIDPKHPLLARVTVNRLWQVVMGRGLVSTANDFGAQGAWPTHADLLDWLAVEFVESGWDVKHIMRLILTSATYQQASDISPQLLEADPDNELYARAPRFRLAAEFVRDNALAVSGLLQREVGGPSVFPYQPAGLWEELSSREDSKNWTAQFYEQSKGKDLYRRSMYTFWKRTSPPPSLQAFDAPDRETCIVQRDRTSTPLQALILLNDPTYVEAARKLAERIMHQRVPVEEGIAFGFRLATARLPSAHERRLLLQLWERQHARFQAEPARAHEVLSTGESPWHRAFDPSLLAAWTIVSSVILNLDETITKN